jgi:Spy/CpxP family protein refolding chaperone
MRRFIVRAVTVAAALGCLSAAAAAKPPGEGGMMGGPLRPPAFLRHLFRPEQVMKHQAAIGITDAQRAAITAAIRETQDRLLPLQWELESTAEAAAALFAGPRIDPDAALAAAAPVMRLEERIKTEHLRLLIRIKNELTAEQQEKLRALAPNGWRRR